MIKLLLILSGVIFLASFILTAHMGPLTPANVSMGFFLLMAVAGFILSLGCLCWRRFRILLGYWAIVSVAGSIGVFVSAIWRLGEIL